MRLIINDNLSFRSAWSRFRHEWVNYHMGKGMSIAGLAKRAKTTRKTIREIISSPIITELWDDPSCVFCGRRGSLDEHHIDGRAHTDEKIWLCEKCHAMFHGLNNRYKRPSEQ